MQENDLCVRCYEEHTAPIFKHVYIHHDFDATGQEFDSICTDDFELAGFELYCSKCKLELHMLRKAESKANELPY